MNRSCVKSVSWKALFGLSILVGLPGLVRHLLGQSCVAGTVSDVLVALFFLFPVLHGSRKIRFPFLVLWIIVQAGSFELLRSMSRMPSWNDLVYLFDSGFIAHTFSNASFSSSCYQLMFVMGGLALLLPPRLGICGVRLRVITTYALLLIPVFVLHARGVTDDTGERLYSQYNPVHWLIAKSYVHQATEGEGDFGDILRQQLDGWRYIKTGKAKNVLIIVLEGLTGSYLEQSSLHFNLPEPKTQMPLLNVFAGEGMLLPDFVAHGHQTIRGLYSLLCADFSKLSWSTPKATLLHNVPEKAGQCLPNQLKKLGFDTHYLQGAGLVFMGKDRFMPLIGFDHVHGLEWFSVESAQKYHWGVDDKTFFSGALTYIDDLRKAKRPWMLTLLTVGTHQPYEVTDEFASAYADKKQAAVANLDQAVSKFLGELKKRGVFKETLIIVTADESHGSELGDWGSAWVPAIVFAPEQNKLPKINASVYGLIDTTLSVLDYFAKTPPDTPGRSFFRKYRKPREMVSFTADRLRWLDETGTRIECNSQGKCQLCAAQSLIGPADCQFSESVDSPHWVQKAKWLDQNLNRLSDLQTLHFATGKKQVVKKPWQDQWADNLVGAQYLDFAANTETEVFMKWKIIKAPADGAQMVLSLKESDHDIDEPVPVLPVLHAGQTSELSFKIQNKTARANFSFHLLAETPLEMQLLDFTVVIKKKS
ncbi:MAG: hypothetical protein ACD_62C00008G0002 [uncultured bacterium]|nr:MAG: hypothetical protein ACD_62C00008G0002 [uncultured bacterium]